MTYETIDTTEAVYQFRQLMQPNSSFHILRLVGEGKMGKSHLLTKVFPHHRKRMEVIDPGAKVTSFCL